MLMPLTAPDETAQTPSPAQTYVFAGQQVVRSVQLRDGSTVMRGVQASPVRAKGRESEAAHQFVNGLLREANRPSSNGEELRIVDLFSGCGGLSLGIDQAVRAIGRRPVSALALDMNVNALNVFEKNFDPEVSISEPIGSLIDRAVGDPLSATERKFKSMSGHTDILVGGPPCQGNSDLNNHTRRNDPRNELYFSLVRAAEVLDPKTVIIENVPGVLRAKNNAVQRSIDSLRSLGYEVTSMVLNSHDFGSAQKRKRHFLVGSRDLSEPLSRERIEANFAVPQQNLMDAIGDLGLEPEKGVFGTAARHSDINLARMQYLLENDKWDLPNSLRPACHRDKPHSYKAVYGRMYADRPSPTITSGFGSTGQGRFMHPLAARTLTPHEAARLQGFPDWFDFGPSPQRRALQVMIGNAVPSQLGYAIATEVLR